ncbi:MAG TPA: TIGR03118 family protein [Micropepsaceae bacterium]|nr:TIGR03118 family protein [Micropepsaceae bacterium]
MKRRGIDDKETWPRFHQGTHRREKVLKACAFAGGLALVPLPAHAVPSFFLQSNLVTSNQAVLTSLGYRSAANVDTSLINPWGISHSATSPFWVSDNGAGVSTLYNTAGVKQGLVVSIPPPGTVTGQVNNIGGANDFQVAGAKSNFIFATEAGTIAARAAGTAATTMHTTAGAVYKGLAIGNNGSGFFLYAANFNSGKIDVFDHNFNPVSLSGSFTDAGLPAGYAPFNVQTLNGQLYVTYALQDASKKDDVAGPGNGFVSVFDLNGNFIARVASTGLLNSPWGLDIAPAGFGSFAGDLLVGNFGDGTINAYDPVSHLFLGQLTDAAGNPIVLDGLWALINGNGGNGGNPNRVYFTAGINGEEDGLFGSLQVPEPGTLALLGSGLAALIVLRRRKSTPIGR